MSQDALCSNVIVLRNAELTRVATCLLADHSFYQGLNNDLNTPKTDTEVDGWGIPCSRGNDMGLQQHLAASLSQPQWVSIHSVRPHQR